MSLLGNTRTSIIAALCRHIITRSTLDGLWRRESCLSESIRCQIYVIITTGHYCILSNGSAMLFHFNCGLGSLLLIYILAGYREATHFSEVIFAFRGRTEVDILLRSFFNSRFSFERHVHFLTLVISGRVAFISVTSLQRLGDSLSWSHSLSRWVMIAVGNSWIKVYLSVIILVTSIPSIGWCSEWRILHLMRMMMLHVIASRGRRYVIAWRSSFLQVVHQGWTVRNEVYL